MAILEKIKDPKDLRLLERGVLPELAKEVRQRILDTVSKKGGHLGSSLGATELTIALHYVFNTPIDRLVWDTGHQTYGHKLLTGRQDRFDTLRQLNGLSGFLKRDESPYDAFGAGHASTAISAALGMAVARDQQKEDHRVVAIVSDGCITGGMSFEAMQNAGHVGADLLVVLNDNEMFISNRVGALGAFLAKLLTGGLAKKLEQEVEKFLKRIQFYGAGLLRVAKRMRVLLFPGMLFEELGFSYFGPVDGHDVNRLVEVLENIKTLKGPVLLHIVTKKGKGYEFAEQDPITWHGPGKFDVTSGAMIKPATVSPPAYQNVFGQALVKLAKQDPRVIAITAAMPEGTGTDLFRKEIPSRFYDVGLAEQHAVTFAAGMVCEGLRPVVAIYSTFLQRAYDQMEHDVGLQKLPVVFCLDRAGLVGEDGPTHHGVFDFAYSRMIPNFVVMAPGDENELQHMLKTALSLNQPSVIRYPRGPGEGVPLDAEFRTLPVGRGVVLKPGADVYLLAIGSMVHPCLKAATLIEKEGIPCGVVNMRFVKPIDIDLLRQLLQQTRNFVTVEDHVLIGGFGSAVLEALEGTDARVRRLGIPDRFIDHGPQLYLRDLVGLSPEKIAKSTLQFLRANKAEAEAQPAR
ncbi:MAG: 1-deoxy-D-xylulose-5-phosphate synthase [Elusimicrobia bacterium RIFCSPLOWO2_01_FULL_59_12]|nr:MAG: 1-deoxy-D-xylulose-5-phosphate synthase [Elusimicrobia bacterium RIFCSPLOWO2_01_FULL_59_12]